MLRYYSIRFGLSIYKAVKKAMLEAKANDGWTALMGAAWSGNNDVVNTLLVAATNDEIKKAILEAKANDGRAALIWAVLNSQNEVVNTLCQQYKDMGMTENEDYQRHCN